MHPKLCNLNTDLLKPLQILFQIAEPLPNFLSNLLFLVSPSQAAHHVSVILSLNSHRTFPDQAFYVKHIHNTHLLEKMPAPRTFGLLWEPLLATSLSFHISSCPCRLVLPLIKSSLANKSLQTQRSTRNCRGHGDDKLKQFSEVLGTVPGFGGK